MMSSDGEMNVVASCIKAGAQDYLVKPVRYQNLKELETIVLK